MTRPNHLFCWLLGLWVLVLPGRLTAADDLWNLGPLYDNFPLTLDPGERTEALAPFFYTQKANESEHTFAVPPLFADLTDPVTQRSELDILYPILTCTQYGSQYRWQLLQLFNIFGGESPEGITNRQVSIFPIYFQQRSPDPTNNYTAVFPIYGHFQHRLFRDRIFFVLFPGYSETQKRDIVTDNYLYPIVHIRHGNGLKGWQVWPIIGREHKVLTTVTNGFGDVDLVGGHEYFFAGWPVYDRRTDGIGTTNLQKELDVLPFYSRTRSPGRDTTSYLWPFFNIIDDRDKKYHEWEGPWPFVVFTHGPGKTTRRILPLFNLSHGDQQVDNSYLWPVFKYNAIHTDVLDRGHFRILFFLYSDVTEKNIATGKVRKRTDFLPLFTYHRDFNGNTRLQILAVLEPFFPNNPAIEREWSPVWSLWRSEHNPTTGASNQSLLWNLYRRDVTPTAKKCSLLFGLIQYQSTMEATRLRLLFVPVMNSKKSPSSSGINANVGAH